MLDHVVPTQWTRSTLLAERAANVHIEYITFYDIKSFVHAFEFHWIGTYFISRTYVHKVLVNRLQKVWLGELNVLK